MGDVLQFRSDPVTGREHADPWYEHPDLMAKNIYGTHVPVFDLPDPLETEFVIARTLPDDTYVPQEYVVACVTTSVWWHKRIDVSWMTMEFVEYRGCEVPMQHHRKGAVVMYVEDDCMSFAIASPDDLTEPVTVHAMCVTDIGLCDLVPTPLSPREKQALAAAQTPGLQVDG